MVNFFNLAKKKSKLSWKSIVCHILKIRQGLQGQIFKFKQKIQNFDSKSIWIFLFA